VAVLGPTISQAAYEVGPDFAGPLRRRGPALLQARRAAGPLHVRPSRLHRRAPGGGGIGEFADLGLCTYSDEDQFFSYRRTTHRGEPDYGRLISAITLAAPVFIP
jgi:copper oxidase (laccase) domain-containing protein